jgi:hypothetical protein
MTHYVEYFELHPISISLHLLSISLPVNLSLPLSYYLPVFIIPISFSTLSGALQSKQPNKFKQQHYGLPHVMFLINPVFETIIHLAFNSFKHDFTLKVISLPNKAKLASQLNTISYSFQT